MATRNKDLRQTHEDSLDHGWAWVVMVATSCTFFVTGGLLFSTGLVQTALLQKFGESPAKTAWAGSLFMSLSNLGGPIGTILMNRLDCRRALMVASVLMTSGFLMATFAGNLNICIIGCGAVSGTGSGIAFSVSFVGPGFNFRKRLNLVMGLSIAASGLGTFALSPLMEIIRERFGYQGFFMLLSSLSLQIVVIGALMRPSQLEAELKLLRHKNFQDGVHDLSVFESISQTIRSYRNILLNKYALCLSLSLCLYNGGNYISYMVWPSFCISKGLTPMQSAFVLSVTGAVYIIGRIVTGLISSSRLVDERIVYSGSMLIHGGLLFLFQLYSGSYTGHMVSAVLLGLVNGSCWVMLLSRAEVMLTTINSKYIGVDSLSTANGIEFIFAGIGPLIISAISGIMLEANCTYEQIFMMCGGSLLLGALIGTIPMMCCGCEGHSNTDKRQAEVDEKDTQEVLILK